jgi:hypothetical protein
MFLEKNVLQCILHFITVQLTYIYRTIIVYSRFFYGNFNAKNSSKKTPEKTPRKKHPKTPNIVVIFLFNYTRPLHP